MEKLIVEEEFLEDEEDRIYTKEFTEKTKIEVEKDLFDRKCINIYSDIISYLENVGLYRIICENLTVDRIIHFLQDIKTS
tara:strand:- start:15 stop:254 length:240 start_codon:yes stop_codon:yes gene_type:complete